MTRYTRNRTQKRKGIGVLIVLAVSLLSGWWLVQQ